MPSHLPHVRPSEPVSAAAQNALIDRVNAAGRLSAGGQIAAAHGAGGLRVAAGGPPRLAVWQLTGPMERAYTDGIPDDVPSAPADPVWYFRPDGSPPENEYQDALQCSRPARLYHVAAFPGDQRRQLKALQPGQPGDVATPKLGPGDWVTARYNGQSGRWEVLSGPEDLWRFELKTPLMPDGDRDLPSTAAAWLVVFDPQEGKYVKTGVEFPVADFLDVCNGRPGDRGYAKRLADSHLAAGWEVVVLKNEPSSSSGEESSGESSSGEGSSSGESSGESSGPGPGGLSTTLDVVACEPYRAGDMIYFPQKRMSFVDGLLVGVTDLPATAVYVCCPESSGGDSSSGDSSGGDSSSGDSSGGAESSGEESSGEESSGEESSGA